MHHMLTPLVTAAAAFVAALVAGTLIEYSVHRLMHCGKILGRKHAEHHRDGRGQGWAGEFRDYFVGVLPLLVSVSVTAWLVVGSPGVAAGWAVGGTLYAALARVRAPAP